MRVIECMHTQSRCYGIKRQSANQVGIVVHSTGANNPYIKRYSQPSGDDAKKDELLTLLGVNEYGNHWNRSAVSKAVHYVIGKLANGSVATVQNLPENIACWGAGKGSKGSYNYDPVAHIQFEICEDGLTDKSYFDAIYKEATELCADICHRHGWDASVIVSHKEARAKGYASNHRDIDHWLKSFKLTMNDFRSEVQRLLDEMNKPKEPEKVTLYSVTANDLDKKAADALIAELTNKGYTPVVNSYEVIVEEPEEIIEKAPEEIIPEVFEPYKVKVNTKSGVKIRSGAGTNYGRVGAIKNGTVVTIVEESTGKGANLWGKLSDGRGWIAVDYTVRKE